MNDLGQAAVSADKAPRTERGRRTVRKLLEAAAQEFGQRGFHEAAITGITQRAGVALGTFYTYFESKEELFRALVRDMSQATRAHVAEAVRGAPDRLAAERLGLAAATAKGQIVEGPDELRAWALIGMSVFLGMRYGIWNEDMTPAEVADGAIDLVSEGLRSRPA